LQLTIRYIHNELHFIFIEEYVSFYNQIYNEIGIYIGIYTIIKIKSFRYNVLQSHSCYHPVAMENLTDISEPQVQPNEQTDQ